jgi:hypothetical protein
LYVFQEVIPVEEVFSVLQCSSRGLSSSDAARRLEIFGPNKLEEKKVPSPHYDPIRSAKNTYVP